MENLDKKFIDIYLEIGRGQGLDDLLTTIFARLYIEPDDIAMEDLAKDTGYSLASISNKVNLIGINWPIKKIRKPGSKKIFLHMDKNLIEIIKNTALKNEEFCINTIKLKLPALIKEYKCKAKSKEDKRKLKILEDYYNQTLKLDVIFKDMIKSLNKLS